MNLNNFLPNYDYVEKHKVIINSSADKVYAAVLNLNLRKSKLLKFLFRLREYYAILFSKKVPRKAKPLGLSMDELVKKSGFIYLDKVANQEVILGVVGKLWKPSAEVVKLGADEFTEFAKEEYLKVVWNFHLQPTENKRTILSTESRIQCLGKKAKRYFSLYWFFVRPFSGWTRILMLKIIKEQAEDDRGEVL